MNKNFLIKIFFFILACVHFIIVHHFSFPYNELHQTDERITYIITKIIAFFIITFIYQAIPFVFINIKNGNEKVLKITKYTAFYFILSVLLFAITKPFSLTFHDCHYIIPFTDKFQISWFPGLIASSIFIISKNIFPSVFSVSIICSFIYSIIFAYCTYQVRIKYKPAHYLIVLFFSLPSMLLFSLVQYRQIFASYIFCFIIFYIFFNQKKENNNFLKALSLGLLSAILIFIRSENFFLIIFLPFLIYLTKIFNKKSFITYVLSTILFFTPLVFITKHFNSSIYEFHNMAIILKNFKMAEIPYTEYENNKEIFNKVFPDLMENSEFKCNYDELNTETEIQIKKLLYTMILKNIPKLIKYNINRINYELKNTDFMMIEPLKEKIFYMENPPYWVKNTKHLKFKQKLISLLAYGNLEYKSSKTLQIMYNSITFILLIFIGFITGLILRNKYFIFSFIILAGILIQLLAFMPFYQFFYFYPIILITPLLLLLEFLSLINHD